MSDEQQDDFDHANDEFRDHDIHGEEEYDEEEHDLEESHNVDIYHDGYNDSQQIHGEHGEGAQYQNSADMANSVSDDLNTSFERDTANLLKVKATIMVNINQTREANSLPCMYQDITLSSIAMQFATSLKGKEFDKNYLEKLKELERNDCDFKISHIIAEYEEDVQITKEYTIKYFIEMGHLFFETDVDRKILLDPANNHIGIGLAGNESNIVIVLFTTQRDIAITEILDKGDMVEVKGRMLDYSIGICGVKIYNNESFDKIKKEKEKQEAEPIYSVLYDKIEFNRTTKEFIVYLEIKTNWKEKRWIELLTRDNPDAIAYHRPRKEKDKEKNYFKHLKPKLRALFILYPDLEYIEEYKRQTDLTLKEDLKKQEQERLRVEEELKEQQIQQEEEESEKIPSDDEEEEVVKVQDNKDAAVSNKQIREELQLAITEAKNTYENLLMHNKELQERIKELKSKTDTYVEKSETTMNQHKYLNTLTQVHQTRVDLQTTQDRYNRMSLQLQNKLNEKQAKCNQIRIAFLELKREVAKKAAYSRSDLPIKQPKIEEWENAEKKLAIELQNLRLDILRLRNTLTKNQKVLKKKQQLAEGLHLIDFEQLKIENQTLNEKIEERNEDLHKLKKKTTTIVQILTHTREKLGFVVAKRDSLSDKSNELDDKIKEIRSMMGQKKEACEALKTEIQEAKQETEIVNSQELVVDYKNRNAHIDRLKEEIRVLLQKEKDMKTVIDNYQRKMKKEVIKR